MSELIDFPQHGLTAYRSDPTREVRGAVIVIQEIWGLVEHITDIADRLAAQGYLAVAPDLLGHVGLSPEAGQRLHELVTGADEEARARAQPELRAVMRPARSPEFAAWAVPALRAVVDYCLGQPGVDGAVGVVGFCFGGTYAYQLALAEPRLRAAVPFYGHFPDDGDVRTIACPVLAFYGEEDHGITDSVPALEERMRAAGVDFTAQVYAGAGHAFFNDTSPRYVPAAAADAWERTLLFLEDHLGRA